MIRITSFEKMLAAFLVFFLVLLYSRIGYTGRCMYAFLLWNIFLGWLPYWFSKKALAMRNITGWVFASSWLLFFPNSLYIITDLIHLESKRDMPIWFDALLVITAAILGILFAFASLYKMEKFFEYRQHKKLTKIAMVGIFFISSFGVYLGRFLRWNSWDVFTNPISLGKEIGFLVLRPIHHYKSWVITVLFTCFFSLLYFTLKKLPSLLKEYE